MFAQTLALSWDPSALGRGWHLVWPVSPTEALWLLLGCALNTAGVSHPMVPPMAQWDHCHWNLLQWRGASSRKDLSGSSACRSGVLQWTMLQGRGNGKQGQLCQTPVTSCGCSVWCAVHTAEPLQQQLDAA